MIRERTIRLAALLAPLSLVASAAVAQTGGEVLWTVAIDGFATMSQPRVAADGTIYLVTDELYAISPAGQILWTRPAFQSYVDVGSAGTIYAAGSHTIFAYAPDGSLQWSFTDSGGQGIMQGPTLGPDGNLYAISDFGGLGAFSLTPSGQLRWNVPGFSNNGGTGLGRVQFGPENLYFAEDRAPGCGDLTSGLASVTLDGQLDWCLSISGPSRPWATLDGKALTWQGEASGKTLFAYRPDSSLAWTHTFGWSPVAIGSVVVGLDGNIYAFHAISKLASLTADGDLRWEQSQPIDNFPWRAAIAPDVAALVSSSGYGFGANGTILAVDPADGSTLWSIPVTGAAAGAGAPAEFSPDGSVVYVPIHTIDSAVPDEVWAIRVHDGAPGSIFCVGDGASAACPCGNSSASMAQSGCAHSGGAGASLRGTGTLSVDADDLRITLASLPQNQPGMLFRSTSASASQPFRDGLLCLSSPFYRFAPKSQNAGGTITYGPGIVALTQGHGPIQAGETWRFQGWYRDPAGPCGTGSNLTNALELSFTP